MRKFLQALALSMVTVALHAQDNPLSRDAKADYATAKRYIIQAAEEMPDAGYGFRPTPEVRTFGQQIAHIADDQYNLCGPVRRETKQRKYTEIEDTFTAKSDLVLALKKAFSYCDVAYDALTDASASEVVTFFKTSRPKLSMLNWNTWHTWEHYGNIVVYLRIKGLVPPSSAPQK